MMPDRPTPCANCGKPTPSPEDALCAACWRPGKPPMKDRADIAPQPCEHKWVFLRDGGIIEAGYRRYRKVDLFFCERCLEQRRIESDIPERRGYGAF